MAALNDPANDPLRNRAFVELVLELWAEFLDTLQKNNPADGALDWEHGIKTREQCFFAFWDIYAMGFYANYVKQGQDGFAEFRTGVSNCVRGAAIQTARDSRAAPDRMITVQLFKAACEAQEPNDGQPRGLICGG